MPLRKFWLDETAVSNSQFLDFVKSTSYVTDAEIFGYWTYLFIHTIHFTCFGRWSFVLDSQVSDFVQQQVDGESGMGRVRYFFKNCIFVLQVIRLLETLNIGWV